MKIDMFENTVQVNKTSTGQQSRTQSTVRGPIRCRLSEASGPRRPVCPEFKRVETMYQPGKEFSTTVTRFSK